MFTRRHGRSSRQTSGSSRRLAWVLALALLLPFAQALAWAHTLSHYGAQRSDAVASPLDSPCALCLSAAPVHGGGLPSTQAAAMVAPLVQAAPPADNQATPRPVATPAYRSRAPPLALT